MSAKFFSNSLIKLNIDHVSPAAQFLATEQVLLSDLLEKPTIPLAEPSEVPQIHPELLLIQETGPALPTPLEALDEETEDETITEFSDNAPLVAQVGDLETYQQPTSESLSSPPDGYGLSASTNTFELAPWIDPLTPVPFENLEFAFPIRPFEVEIFDSDFAPDELTLAALAENDPPVAFDDFFSTAWDNLVLGDVLADNGSGADFDPNGDPLTVSLISGPAGADTFTLNPDGTFNYTATAVSFPAGGFDSFVYQISDPSGETAQATVSILVTV